LPATKAAPGRAAPPSARRGGEPVIQLDGVSVRYRVPHERIVSIKEYAIKAIRRRVTFDDFWALRDVDLEVRAGEAFGIVGRNGAGKSTLLKVIARVLRPTTGRVRLRGLVAPLLELGAAFHPELTGRENVYLNSALLGFGKAATRDRFDDIVEFADIANFIDAPLRTYSTGMVARLGFAVATAVRPDILVVDEVLSVGDVGFQEKCRTRMEAYREAGTTIMIITHNTALVRQLCDRAAWLDAGRIRDLGDPDTITRDYERSEG